MRRRRLHGQESPDPLAEASGAGSMGLRMPWEPIRGHSGSDDTIVPRRLSTFQLDKELVVPVWVRFSLNFPVPKLRIFNDRRTGDRFFG